MSDAPDISGIKPPYGGPAMAGGHGLSASMLQNIEAIRVHETLIERIAIALGLVNYIHQSNEIRSHCQIGPKGRFVKMTHEVCDLLEFIPGFDVRIVPDGYRKSDASWHLPQEVGGVGWISTSSLRQYLMTVLYIIHNDDVLHVQSDVDEEGQVPPPNDEVIGDGIKVYHVSSKEPTSAPPCALTDTIECTAQAHLLAVPAKEPPPLNGDGKLDIRSLTYQSANTPKSPLGDSVGLDALRARIILAFPVKVHGSVSTFKRWIHDGGDRPHTYSGEKFHLDLPEGVVISKQGLDNLAYLFQAGLGAGVLRRPRLINTDALLSEEEDDGDPSPHRLLLRNKGLMYT